MTPMRAAPQHAPLQFSRRERRVLRANLRIASEASRFEVTCALEESLRLATLPGEDEGRIYVFNKVSVSGLPAHVSKRIWLDRVQSTLVAIANSAVPGSHPSAAFANAVYFNNLEDAFETLLSIVLKAIPSVGAGTATDVPWFVSAFLNLPTPQEIQKPEELIEALMAKMNAAELPVPVAACILLDRITEAGFVRVLSALSESTLLALITDLGPMPSVRDEVIVSTPALAPERVEMMRAVTSHFGWNAPATIWVASLIVAASFPACARHEIAQRAFAILRDFEMAVATIDATPETSTGHPVIKSAAKLHEQTTTAAQALVPVTTEDAKFASTSGTGDIQWEAPAPLPLVTSQHLLGEFTPSAGLYFLLHVLRHLGIAAALHDNSDLAEADLPAHILHSLALRCGVRTSDPILQPLIRSGESFVLSYETLSTLSKSALPRLDDGTGDDRIVISAKDLLDRWTRAVRLWCLQSERIASRCIIHRPGLVWMTRTDLDVTLPLTGADIRIRRAGLDLDPLWLPWFGPMGRVVRFHYGDPFRNSGAA